MWMLVTPSWWFAMAAWLDNKKDFCLHVANAIAEAAPQEPEPLDTSERVAEDPNYMTHNVTRKTSDDGTTVKVTGWCTGCSPDNCSGCCHYEDGEA